MNLFTWCVLGGVVALDLRTGSLLGHWGVRQAWYWRDFLDASQVSCSPLPAAGVLTRGALFRAFVRERLEVWCASLLWGFSPALSWRERRALGGVQVCMLLLTLGWRVPLMVLGLDHCAQRHWSGWPSRQERRWRADLHQRLMALVGNEALLKRVTLARLYATVEDVPPCVAQQDPESVH